MPPFDPIAAVATALGPGAVAIVRLSGPEAVAIASRLFRTPRGAPPRTPLADRPSHRVHHGWLVDPASGERLDEALVLVMRGPRSFTGEDVVELQTHGGQAAGAVLGACLREGARLAAPGEFTKRAFLHGRLDLAQAEAIGDVVDARTERALALALGQLEGRLSRDVAAARAALVALLARLEAEIDYPDEIDPIDPGELRAGLDAVDGQLAAFLATARQGQVLREGAALAIVGRPNVGKSSLLNALLGRARAIVTDVPGTTRDVLEETLDLAGVPFRVVDTAGIRETHDVVEAIGVARSREALAQADLVALVVDLVDGPGEAEAQLAALAGDRPLVVVGNKLDAWDVAAGDPAARLAPLGGRAVAVSAATGEGLGALVEALVAAALGGSAGASPTAVNARHRRSLEAAAERVGAARAAAAQGLAADFVAWDLKEAIAAMGEITGDALADEVIDEVFRRFCVGK